MSDGKPRVFLYEDQINAMFRTFESGARRDLIVNALGMALDGDDVFHVYTAAPRTHFAGTPCGAQVTFVAEPESQNAIPQPGVRVSIVLRVVDGAVVAQGFVDTAAGLIEADVEFVPVRSDLYTRSRGLLETDALARRSVAVVGLGSGGSSIAVQLAQAGVGRMVIIDRDRLEIGNVSRHACGVGDLGRRKTLAVRDLLVGKNPDLEVVALDMDIVSDTEALYAALAGVDLLVAATDSDRSRFVLNQAALDLDLVALYGRVLSRACGGEVARVRPGASACLACIYTERFLMSRPREYSSLADARSDASAYVDVEDLNATIQVGLASDIAPVSNLMVKLALVELSRGGNAGIASLDEDLTADFYLWANRREAVYSSWPVMGSSFTTPSILRWYGATHPRLDSCAVCSLPSMADAGATSIFVAG